MAVRRVPVDDHLDVRRTLAHDHGARFVADGSMWRATRTPTGPATGRYRPLRWDGVVEVEAWGPGAGWLLEHAPDVLGCGDDPAPFDELSRQHPIVRRLHRVHRGLRIPRTLAVYETLLPVILAQKVTSMEAGRAWRGLVARWGEPAPGPAPLRLPPAPAVLATLPYHAFHPLGVERKRAETVRRVAREVGRLDAVAALSPADAAARLEAMPGIGPWTVAEVAIVALGDADAVSVGDYHLPHQVSLALAGERRGSDERMLELLAPFAGHRGRVVRLIESAGIRPERRGPRLAPRSFSRL